MAMKALSTRCQVPKRVTKFGLALEIMNLITMTTQSWKLFRRAILSRLFSIMHQRTKTISARWISIWSSDILYYNIPQSLAQQGTYNPPAPNTEIAPDPVNPFRQSQGHPVSASAQVPATPVPCSPAPLCSLLFTLFFYTRAASSPFIPSLTWKAAFTLQRWKINSTQA